MSGKAPKSAKGKDWTAAETGILIQLVLEKEDALFGSYSGTADEGGILKKRRGIWAEIAAAVSQCGTCVRTSEQVKKKYSNIKMRACGKIADLKYPKTGGGPCTSALTQAEEALVQGLEGRAVVFGLDDGVDTDAPNADHPVMSTSTGQSQLLYSRLPETGDVRVIIAGHPADAKCVIGNLIVSPTLPVFRNKFVSRNTTKYMRHANTLQGRAVKVTLAPSPLAASWDRSLRDLQRLRTDVVVYVVDKDAIRFNDVDDVISLRQQLSLKVQEKIVLVVYEDRPGQPTNFTRLYEECKSEPIVMVANEAAKRKETRNAILRKISVCVTLSWKLRSIGIGTRPSDQTINQVGDRSDARRIKPVEQPTQTATPPENLLQENDRPKTADVPLRNLTTDDWSRYSRTLKEGEAESCHIRVMVVGHHGVGKTTLVRRLQDLPITTPASPTQGLEIHNVTTQCLRTNDDKYSWDFDQNGFKDQMNIQRMASAYRAVTKTPETEPQEGDGLGQEEEQREEPKEPLDEQNKQERLDGGEGKDNEVLISSEAMVGSDEVDEVESMLLKVAAGHTYLSHDEKYANLQKVVRNAENSKDDRVYLSYWDFAGEPTYYSTHQAFLASSAVYLLVVDLSKALDTELDNEDRFDADISAKRPMKVIDTIEFWLGSILTYALDSNGKPPPVILVGTFLDKLKPKEGEADRKLDEIVNRLSLKDIISVKFASIAIDNSLNSKRDGRLEKLRQGIVQRAGEVKETPVPAQWVELESQICQRTDVGQAISLPDLIDINKESDFPMSDQMLLLFLHHQHCRGTMLHYRTESLRDFVILDPALLVRFMNLILRRNLTDSFSSGLRVHSSANSKDGLFDGKYLNELIQDADDEIQLNKGMLMKILIDLHIIHPFKRDSVLYFFMPSLLKKKPPAIPRTGSPDKESSTLVLKFKRQPTPPSLFHRLVASVLKRWTPVESKGVVQLFCGYACLEIGSNMERLVLYTKQSKIHFKVLQLSEQRTVDDANCKDIRSAITIDLDEILRLYRHNVEYELMGICPEHKMPPQYISFGRYSTASEGVCDYDDQYPHSVSKYTALRYWCIEGERPTPDPEYLHRCPSEKEMGRLARSEVIESLPQLNISLGLREVVAIHAAQNHTRVERQKLEVLLRWLAGNRDNTWSHLQTRLNLPDRRIGEIVNWWSGYQPLEHYVPHPEVTKFDRPPSDKDLGRIARALGHSFEFVFLELDVPMVTIEQVSYDKRNSCINAVSELFFTWRNGAPHDTCTVRTVLDAIVRAGENIRDVLAKLDPQGMQTDIASI